MQCLYGIWGSVPGKSGQNQKSEPVTPKSDQKHEKIFYRCPHPKAEQNYLASEICYNGRKKVKEVFAMNLLFAVNDGFVDQMLTAVYSILENTQDQLDFYVLQKRSSKKRRKSKNLLQRPEPSIIR